MQQHDFLRGPFVVAAFVVLLTDPSDGPSYADEIILRNLDVIADRTVQSFDADGVRLDDGSVLGWDRIEEGSVRPDLQASFNEQLSQLGKPLYLVRQRLRVGEYRDVMTHANALYSIYQERRSPTSYMVAQAKMWAHLSLGEREAALEPYLRCCELLRRPTAGMTDLPGRRRLPFDRTTGLTTELTPIWFDSESAKNQLPAVREAIANMQRPRPEGVYIYYATLALAANDLDQAKRGLDAIRGSSAPVSHLKRIALAQSEVVSNSVGVHVSALTKSLDTISQDWRPLALYWLGRSQLLLESRDARLAGTLQLLKIPAHHGTQRPELAAAALYLASDQLEKLQDSRGSLAVRNELLDQFGQTYFADRVRSATNNP